MKQKLYGGIETGGTKFICAIGDTTGEIIKKSEIETENSVTTLKKVSDFFIKNEKICALGIGSFGPLNLDPSSKQFGYITNTPKKGWSGVDIKGYFERTLNVSVVLDTDANCSAYGEKYFGLAKNCENFIYITVGTGIGGSVVINNKPYRGKSHPEIGHILIPHEQFSEYFKGVCPYHVDCLEGIASGYAMQKRWGKKGEDITSAEAWDLEARYLGSAINNLALTLEPQLFILGGGVLKHAGLIEDIRKYVALDINNYIGPLDLSSYIVASKNQFIGVLGAIKIASELDNN